MAKIDTRAFQLLGEKIRVPKAPPTRETEAPWVPDLNPTEQKAWESEARFMLCHGPKGGGKSWIAVMKLVKHCWENQNGLALILVRTQNMAKKGGAWDKLQSEIIPLWKENMGIEFSDVKTDSQHFQYVWVENRHGTWSMIVVMSSPHAHQLRERVRGMEPSMVFVDELTSCPSNEYFQSIAAQLGRRAGVEGCQQYIGACNPDGPSHWVYNQFFITPVDEDTGEWDNDYEVLFFPREENRHRIPDGYFEGLKKIYKGDDIESARMEDGEWIDRPSGEALFAEIYNPTVHVRPLTPEGRPDHRLRIRPNPEYAAIVGIDPGSIYNAVVFQQYLPINQKMTWVIFDEIIAIKKRINYTDFIPMVMRRLRWWRDEIHKEIPQVWISDSSAFNQWRAASGSFDVYEMEKIYEFSRAKYRLEPMKIKDCPKFNGSKVARTRLGQQLLSEERIVVSAACANVNRMFMTLEGKKPKAGEPLDPEALLTAQRGDYIHTWDAVSYPWLMASLNPTALLPSSGGSQTLIRSAA